MYGMLVMEDESDYDDKMMNLYDFLIQSQADNTPVSRIIGENVEDFCESYFKKEKKTNWDKIVNFIYRVAWLSEVYFVIVTMGQLQNIPKRRDSVVKSKKICDKMWVWSLVIEAGYVIAKGIYYTVIRNGCLRL